MYRRREVDRPALLSSRKISRLIGLGNDCRRLIARGPMRLETDYKGGARGERLEIWWQGPRQQAVGFRFLGRKIGLAAGAHTWRR
jgi:hypothetical protein